MARKIISGVEGEAGERVSPNKKEAFRMTKEQFKGSWQEFKGEVKKKWGQFTDNDLLEAQGDDDKFLDIVQKALRRKRKKESAGRRIGTSAIRPCHAKQPNPATKCNLEI
jgi:uncharacterized protein YjbJ (UPF0337 family)